jgi:pilus assembly protein CpaF
MRPDRIIVGECRGGEALDMLQAMNTGHEGSLTTAHANSPRDLLSRIEVMVLMAGVDLPIAAVREQIASALHVIVQQARFPCGTRVVTRIVEVTGVESGIIQTQDIFRFERTGTDEEGRVQGCFRSTGHVPIFYEQLRDRGVRPETDFFEPPADSAIR